jgi:hypothetical protein
MRSTRERASLRVQLDDIVPRPRQIARILEAPLAHRIATPGQPPHPIFGTTFSKRLGVRLTFEERQPNDEDTRTDESGAAGQAALQTKISVMDHQRRRAGEGS